jgi:hypothetical protein
MPGDETAAKSSGESIPQRKENATLSVIEPNQVRFVQKETKVV